METLKMNQLYQKMAIQLNDMIPDEWSKLYLYGEVLNDSRTIYFFFDRKSDGKTIYHLDIPSIYKVSESIYDKLHDELTDIVVELYNEYKDNNENVWTNFTFVMDCNGKFDMKFSYDDVLKSGFNNTERQRIWMYEVMGKEPEKENHKELIRRYLDKNTKLFWK